MAKDREKNSAGMEENPLLWHMEGIDTVLGMEYAGEDAELYREILADYVDDMDRQAEALESAIVSRDAERFTIEIHALKSTSRTIGALELSDRAKELEQYGKSCEWEPILEKIPDFMVSYRNLRSVIMPYCMQDEQDQEKRPVDNDRLSEQLEDMLRGLEEYDAGYVENIISELSGYDFTGDSCVYMEKLVLAMNRFDYGACKEIIMHFRNVLCRE